MKDANAKSRYLSIVSALDESLSEHDEKYHPQGYKEGDRCAKREGMQAQDPADTQISQSAKKTEQQPQKRKWTPEEVDAWKKQWVRYLNSVNIRQLAELLHKFDDDKHPTIMELILEERGRREKAASASHMQSLGEQA